MSRTFRSNQNRIKNTSLNFGEFAKRAMCERQSRHTDRGRKSAFDDLVLSSPKASYIYIIYKKYIAEVSFRRYDNWRGRGLRRPVKRDNRGEVSSGNRSFPFYFITGRMLDAFACTVRLAEGLWRAKGTLERDIIKNFDDTSETGSCVSETFDKGTLRELFDWLYTDDDKSYYDSKISSFYMIVWKFKCV